MDGTKSENTQRIGSVKAAVSPHGEKIHGRKTYKNKAHISFSEESSFKSREHLEKRDIGRLDDSKNSAENEKAQAECELFSARRAVKELTLLIEESNTNARVRKQDLQLLKKLERGEQKWVIAGGEVSNHQYREVVRELEIVKQELSKLKLDVASILEAKAKAEKETEASGLSAKSYLVSAEELRKEIEEVNEEQLLVELARIEAVRESKEIEAQKEAEFAQFWKALEETKARMKDMVKEINHAKELEMKLAVTTSDLNVLQSEMNSAMEKLSMNKRSTNMIEKRSEEEMESCSLLWLAEAELKAAKKELERVKEEGFQFMDSMDVIREGLKQVSEETARLKKIEEKADLTIQNLDSKLVRAKFNLEAASKAEEKAKEIISNLSAALQQLQDELDVAKDEKEQIGKKTKSIKMEIEKKDSGIDSSEERLQAAMEELEKVKNSEAIAVNRLRTLTERTMKARASLFLHSSTIKISNFEYEYLSKRGEEAQEIADKKVAAAQAWVEALKTGEKEILMKTEIAQRRIREFRAVEEKELHGMEKSLAVRKALDGELYNRKKHEREAEASNLRLEAAPRRKSFKENGIPVPSSRVKIRRKSLLSGMQHITRSPSIPLRRRKAIPNSVKFLRHRKIREQM